ncbi:uncharacterized protein [Watersipora subatra]|uniref:uncharacterized protein n=1 Tax=Watersipora subatra TaxID=2589382 RepID=UPI00355B2B0F
MVADARASSARRHFIMSGRSSPQHEIVARRTSDGFLMFDVKLSHIIEQTLLRALNRPDFRKSTIKVIDDHEDRKDNDNCCSEDGAESSLVPSEPNDEYSRLPVQKKRKIDNETHIKPEGESSDIFSKDLEALLKRPCKQLVSPGADIINTNSITSIPSSWLSRGVSDDEKRQFETSIANASLCPYERKKFVNVDNSIMKNSDKPYILPLSDDCDDEYEADPFSPASPSLPDSFASADSNVPALIVSPLYIPQSEPTGNDASQQVLSEQAFSHNDDFFSDVDTVDGLPLDDSPYQSSSLEDFDSKPYFQTDSYS